MIVRLPISQFLIPMVVWGSLPGCQGIPQDTLSKPIPGGITMNSSLTSPMDSDAYLHLFPEPAAHHARGPAGMLPSLAIVRDAPVKVIPRINGFPLHWGGALKLDEGETGELTTDYLRLQPIHPYFLKSGANKVDAGFQLDEDNFGQEDNPPFEGVFAITRWDYVLSESNTELKRVRTPQLDPAHPPKSGSLSETFQFDGVLPVWGWITGNQLSPEMATVPNLYRELSALHQRIAGLSKANAGDFKREWSGRTQSFIAASELRGKPYRLIDQILEAATAKALPGNDPGTLVWKDLPGPDDLTLEVFAEGKLARLKLAHDEPFLVFISTLPDGLRGKTGLVKLGFDAWFRVSADGALELDALFPRIAPGTMTQFEMWDDKRRELFLLSNF